MKINESWPWSHSQCIIAMQACISTFPQKITIVLVREAFKIEKKVWNFHTFKKVAGNDLIRPEMQRIFFSILCTKINVWMVMMMKP